MVRRRPAILPPPRPLEQGRDITMDVQHPALAGSTAQPSMNKMAGLINNHPDARIKASAPVLDIEAIKASMFSLYGLRFRYREFESSYNPTLVEAMYVARTPGGASATLKSIPGLVDTLGRLLGSPRRHASWDHIQTKFTRCRPRFSKIWASRHRSPYAANTTGQAALSLWHHLEGRDRYHSLYPGIADYLVGRHGKIPPTVNPDLVAKRLIRPG